VYNAVPGAVTFVALKGNKVAATVTLVPDSPLGIPMDKLYKTDVDALRRRGRRVAEVSQLSVDSGFFPRQWYSMFNFQKLIFVFKLFRLVLDYGTKVAKLTDFCIAVNPKHTNMYKFLDFRMIGGLKQYGSVNKAPAVALSLDLVGAEKRTRARKALYKIFFSDELDQSVLSGPYTLGPGDLRYFFEEKSNIFSKLTKKQADFIKSAYQGFRVAEKK